MKNLRIVFMGTPHFAVGVLEHLILNKANIVGVVTAPDKPAGRGRKLNESAVKQFALSQDLPILQPTKLKDPTFLEELEALKADLQIIVAFRMLPKVVWAMPSKGTFNLHASLLPQYRGAAPIHWAVINGETETGVTTFFIDEKIDTGAIIAAERIPIEKAETAGSLHDKLMKLGAALVLRTVRMIADGEAQPKEQLAQGSLRPAPKFTSENTQIDWSRTADELDAFVRGLHPYPIAWSVLVNEGEEIKVKIYEAAAFHENHDYEHGHILSSKKELKVAVQNGYLYIKEMQLPGKRKMKIIDLLNGYQFDDEAKFV